MFFFLEEITSILNTRNFDYADGCLLNFTSLIRSNLQIKLIIQPSLKFFAACYLSAHSTIVSFSTLIYITFIFLTKYFDSYIKKIRYKFTTRFFLSILSPCQHFDFAFIANLMHGKWGIEERLWWVIFISCL